MPDDACTPSVSPALPLVATGPSSPPPEKPAGRAGLVPTALKGIAVVVALSVARCPEAQVPGLKGCAKSHRSGRRCEPRTGLRRLRTVVSSWLLFCFRRSSISGSHWEAHPPRNGGHTIWSSRWIVAEKAKWRVPPGSPPLAKEYRPVTNGGAAGQRRPNPPQSSSRCPVPARRLRFRNHRPRPSPCR